MPWQNRNSQLIAVQIISVESPNLLEWLFYLLSCTLRVWKFPSIYVIFPTMINFELSRLFQTAMLWNAWQLRWVTKPFEVAFLIYSPTLYKNNIWFCGNIRPFLQFFNCDKLWIFPLFSNSDVMKCMTTSCWRENLFTNLSLPTIF